MCDFIEDKEEIKYVYLLSYEGHMKMIENDDNISNLLINNDYEGLYFKTDIKNLKNKNLETAFFNGINFLSEDDDEIYSNKDNNIPCTETNTIIFFTDIMNKDILPLIIDFYELYNKVPFDKVHDPIIGNCLEDNLPIEWVNFLRPHKFVFNLDSEDLSEAAYFLINEKMLELWGCFIGCPEGLKDRDVNECIVYFRVFKPIKKFNQEECLEELIRTVNQNKVIDSDSESDDEELDDLIKNISSNTK